MIESQFFFPFPKLGCLQTRIILFVIHNQRILYRAIIKLDPTLLLPYANLKDRYSLQIFPPLLSIEILKKRILSL